MKKNLKDYTIQFCYGWALEHGMTMTYYNFSTYYKTRTIILGMKMVLEGVRGCEAQATGWAPVGMGRRVVRLLVAESSAGESPSFITNYLEKL